MIKFNKSAQVILTIACAVLAYVFAPHGLEEPGKRQLFIFIIAALFWAFEVIPLYATSVTVVLLEIFLLCRPDGVLAMDRNGYQVFLLPFGSPIILLFFGGFILAYVVAKYHIDQWIAAYLLKFFGKKPYWIMLGFMMTTAFLSMWMSNTATTALMVAMVIPVLKQLGETSVYKKGLILSIPFAANIGGIATPVGTPPNAIALGILADHHIYVSFLDWMKMAFPLCMVLLLVISFILIVLFPAKVKHLDLKIIPESFSKRNGSLVVGIAGLTILLWLTSEWHRIPSAVIALLPACLFTALGLMNREDFKNIDWDILVLMWGGLALGKGMEISGFTDWIVSTPIFQQKGFFLVALFCLVAVVLSTFMSNTATSNLLIPLVMVIPGESNIMLAAVVALSCSFAMALPISTPPNAIAFATGAIKSQDMCKAGVLVSIVSIVITLIGFKFIITQALGLE